MPWILDVFRLLLKLSSKSAPSTALLASGCPWLNYYHAVANECLCLLDAEIVSLCSKHYFAFLVTVFLCFIAAQFGHSFFSLKFTTPDGPILFDYSKNIVNEETMKRLFNVVRAYVLCLLRIFVKHLHSKALQHSENRFEK